MVGFTTLLLFVSQTYAVGQIALTDDLSRMVVLPATATRIVSLAPSITETLFAIGAGDQVVGVTDYCNFPDAALQKMRVGGIINPSLETIVALRPDLILLSVEGNQRADFTSLESLGTPLFVTNPRSLEGIRKSIRDIGVLTTRTREARQLIDRMKAREDSVLARSRVRKKKGAYFLVSLQPLIVVGQSTFLNELLSAAGAINLAAGQPSPYPTLSREAFLTTPPEVMFIMSDAVADVSTVTKVYPEWQRLSAFQQGRFYPVDSDITSRPGPRAVEALELLHRLLHADSP